MPKVSVIIPTYNRESFILRAIESVFNQTFQDFEIVVVDDGSKDRTKEVLAPLMGRIKYFYQENKGISGARNTAIRQSQGEYLAFLDSDDTWAHDKLQRSIECIEKDNRCGLVYHFLHIIDEKGNKAGTKPSSLPGKDFQELVMNMSDLPTSSILARRKCFDEVGLFDEDLPMMEDYEMWLRIANKYSIALVEAQHPLAFYYRHAQQATKDKISVYKGLVLFDSKLLRIFNDIPIKTINHRLAHNAYMLSRTYFDARSFQDAWAYLMMAMGLDPLVGLSMVDPKASIVTKICAVVKSWLYILILIFKRIGKHR